MCCYLWEHFPGPEICSLSFALKNNTCLPIISISCRSIHIRGAECNIQSASSDIPNFELQHAALRRPERRYRKLPHPVRSYDWPNMRHLALLYQHVRNHRAKWMDGRCLRSWCNQRQAGLDAVKQSLQVAAGYHHVHFSSLRHYYGPIICRWVITASSSELQTGLGLQNKKLV